MKCFVFADNIMIITFSIPQRKGGLYIIVQILPEYGEGWGVWHATVLEVSKNQMRLSN